MVHILRLLGASRTAPQLLPPPPRRNDSASAAGYAPMPPSERVSMTAEAQLTFMAALRLSLKSDPLTASAQQPHVVGSVASSALTLAASQLQVLKLSCHLTSAALQPQQLEVEVSAAICMITMPMAYNERCPR